VIVTTLTQRRGWTEKDPPKTEIVNIDRQIVGSSLR